MIHIGACRSCSKRADFRIHPHLNDLQSNRASLALLLATAEPAFASLLAGCGPIRSPASSGDAPAQLDLGQRGLRYRIRRRLVGLRRNAYPSTPSSRHDSARNLSLRAGRAGFRLLKTSMSRSASAMIVGEGRYRFKGSCDVDRRIPSVLPLLHLPKKPRTGEAPKSLRRADRDAEFLRRLLLRQPDEET